MGVNMVETEELLVKVLSVKRIGDVPSDIKDGYVYFDVSLDVNGRSISIKKKIRLDKPDKMLNKFLSKILMLAEERYKEMKYFVADKTPPNYFITSLINRKAAAEFLYILFEEIDQFVKTGKFEVLATDKVAL